MKHQPAPLVLLHGFTGTNHSFDALALDGAHVPLLAGHGSEPILTTHSFDEEIERISHQLHQFGKRVHLVGYSMGARVALGLCLAHPELIECLTLIGVNPGLEDQGERAARLAWEARWQDVLQKEGLPAFEEQWRNQSIFSSQASLLLQTLDEQKKQRLSHTAQGLSHALGMLGLGSMPNLWPRLNDLETAVQIVVGEKDEKFKAIALKMTALNPRLALVEMSGVGHNPLLEAPERLRHFILSASSLR